MIVMILLTIPVSLRAEPSGLQVPGSWLSSSGSARIETGYPLRARCTGDGVRLRAEPSPEAEVIGHADLGDTLYALGERLTDGEIWYEVEHPSQKGSAWIFGRYLDTRYYTGGAFHPAHALAWQVELAFGATLVKARALFGEPLKSAIEVMHVDAAGEDSPAVTFVYPHHTARYVDGALAAVHVVGKGASFGSFHVGDPASGITEALSAPHEENDGRLVYYGDPGPSRSLVFTVRGGEIAELEYLKWFE